MQVQDLVTIVPWTFIAQICNLFIQVYLIKRFLFKPVNQMLEKRRALADAEIQEAVKDLATRQEVIDSGFDIRTTAQWLQNFYIEKYNQSQG